MKRSIKSRIIRIFIAIILGILSIGLLAYVVLLMPPVQRYVIDFAQNKLSSLLQADISIGSVRADLLSSIELRNLKVKDKNRTDDSIAVGRIKVRYNLAALLTRTISIPGVTIENVYAAVSVSPDNTYHIPAVPQSVFTDTTKSTFDPDSLPFKIHIRRARILNFNGVYNDSALKMVGTVSGALVRGRFHKLDSIQLLLSVPDGSFHSPWWNGNVDTINATGILQFDGIDLNNSYVRAAGSVVKGRGHIAFAEDGVWDVSADVQSDVEPVTAMYSYVPGLKPKGLMTGVAAWKGTLADPVLSCDFSGQSLQYESITIDSIHFSASYGEDKTAHYKFSGLSSMGRVFLDGTLEMPDLMSNPTFGNYKGTLSLDRVKIRELAEDFRVNTEKLPGKSGGLTVGFKGRGFDCLPQMVKISANILDTVFTGGTFDVDAQLVDNKWNMNCRLGDDSISGKGTVAINGPVSGSVVGSVRDLRFFADYFLGQKARGAVFFAADIQGSVQSPAVSVSISGEGLEWNSIRVDTLYGNGTYNNGSVSLSKIVVRGNADLEKVSKLFKLDSLKGNAEFSARLSGPVDALDISSVFKIHNFKYLQYMIDSASGAIGIKSADSLQIKDLRIRKELSELVCDGSYLISKPMGDIDLQFFDLAGESAIPHGVIHARGSFIDNNLESKLHVTGFNPEILSPWVKELSDYAGVINSDGAVNGHLNNLQGILNTEIYKADSLQKRIAALNCDFGLIDSSLKVKSEISFNDSSILHLSADLPLTSKNGCTFDTSSDRHAAASLEGKITEINDITSLLGNDLVASGKSDINLKLSNKNGSWEIGGTINLENGFINYLPENISATGLTVNTSLSGTIDKPSVEYDITSKNITIPPTRIDSLEISGKSGLDTLIINSATVFLPGMGKLDFSVKAPLQHLDSILVRPGLEAEFIVGRFPLPYLSPFLPENMIERGVCKGMAKIRISNGRPVMIGRLTISKFAIVLDGIEPMIGPADAEIVFSDDTLQLTWLQGKWGKKGTFQGNGYAVWNKSGIGDMRLDLRCNSLALDLPDLAEIAVQSGNIYFTNKKDGYQVGGIIELGESRVVRDLRISDLIDQLQSSSVTAAQGDDSFLQSIGLKIDLKFLEDLRVDMNLGKLQLDGGVTIAGTAAKPTYTGEIHVTQGYINYLDRQFDITKGTFYNYDPYELNPLIDLEASTEVISVSNVVENYTIKMAIKGDLQKPEFRLWADKLPFDEADIMSILTVGRPLGAIGGDLGDRLRTFASSSLLGFGTRKLEQLLGMDRIDIDGDIFNLANKKSKSSDSSSTAPHLTLAKRITPRLMLSYETDLQDFAKMKVSALYRLTKWLFLQGNGGSEDYSLDLLFKFSR